MQEPDIHFAVHGTAGLIELDRPKALNAISYDMAVAISAQMQAWSHDNSITHVVIAGSTPRAFCAGGDVRDLYQYIQRGDFDRTRVYFRAEYNADLDVYACSKPVVSLADGIVMGGGAGLMQCSRYRVASETTRFAMPESAIGLFPDAGASIFLGRIPRPFAMFLGLTGQIIGARDLMLLGLADAVVPSAHMAALRTALLEMDDRIPDMETALALDYGLAMRMSERADFSDGVRAVLVDKSNDASWSPARLEDVTPAMVDAVFDHAGLPALR